MILPLVFVATAAFAYYLHKWYTVWQYSEQFPGPTAWPLVGNAVQMGNNSYDYLQSMMYYVKQYKFQAFRAWIGTQLFVIISDPKDVEIMLSTTKHNDKMDDYRFWHDWIGIGLITSAGSHWFRQRRIITPTFHFNILHEFHVTMCSNLERLVEKLNGYADSGKAFDAQQLTNAATLDMICETAMGVKVNALDGDESELVQAFHETSDMVYARLFSSWKRYDLLWPLSQDYQTNKRAVRTVRSFNQTVITQRKEQLMGELKEINIDMVVADENGNTPKKRQAFLDILLTTSVDGVALTDKEINDEVSTFMAAGHETTAVAIAVGLYHMSIHPEEQQRCYDKQLTMFGDDLSRTATYQELQNMKYLDMFTKESQRMHPAVGMIGRRANEGLVLCGGKKVPPGTSIAILLYAMGQNPAVFENPEVFEPNRFLPENRALKNPYEYVPFSAGSRNCIGQKFANNEVRLVLATLVRHFEVLTPVKPFKPMFGATATTHSDNGIWVRMRRRNGIRSADH